jgi:hypothetical protein
MEVFRPHPRLAVSQVDLHVVTLKRNCPEQAARVGMDPWVEVVNLGGEVCEVEPTSVEIKSNEPERPPVNGAILADVDTLHKTHIGVEQELLDAAVGFPGGPGSPHVCDADQALEIGDR